MEVLPTSPSPTTTSFMGKNISCDIPAPALAVTDARARLWCAMEGRGRLLRRIFQLERATAPSREKSDAERKETLGLRVERTSSAMSRRRKHVRDLVDEPCPELAVCEAVCRVVELRGGNHIEVRRGPGSEPGAWRTASSRTAATARAFRRFRPRRALGVLTASHVSNDPSFTRVGREARPLEDPVPHPLEVLEDPVGARGVVHRGEIRGGGAGRVVA